MKRYIVLSIFPFWGGLMGLFLLFSIPTQAQTTEKVLYLNITRSTGAVVSAKLGDGTAAKNPVIDLVNRKVYANGVSMNLSRVSDFRFEVKEEEVNGIKTTEVSAPTCSNIYSIDGQLVRQNAVSPEGLPKGIYISNGKKFVVK